MCIVTCLGQIPAEVALWIVEIKLDSLLCPTPRVDSFPNSVSLQTKQFVRILVEAPPVEHLVDENINMQRINTPKDVDFKLIWQKHPMIFVEFANASGLGIEKFDIGAYFTLS